MKMDSRSFLENYQVTDIEKDPLPIKVLRNAITRNEIPGQAVAWSFEYLDQRSCPLSLISYILEKLNNEVRQTDFSHCVEASGDALDAPVSPSEDTRYEPLKLMRAVVKILDEVCMKEREDFRDSVDGVVESPDMQPHVFAVSYSNIKNARRFMEDRMTILPRLDRMFNLPVPLSYFAVFDGHNGSEAAAYGAAQMHQNVLQSMTQNNLDAIPSIVEAFEQLDNAFIEKCRNGKVKSGSTVVLSLIMQDKLYVAWVGDSQAVLAKRHEVHNLVVPHKPERKDEIERIRRLGGEVIQMNGTYRVNGNLAVSRAIGDADDKTFISSTPDLKMMELDGTEEFLILACDGLWDEISAEQSAHIVRRQVVADANKVSDVSQKLIQQAKQKGSTDNISVIVVFLEAMESIRNRYEGIIESEVEVAFSKQSPEPVLGHSVEGQVNGHRKDSDQLVDFLSFGSSRESGAPMICDDGGNQSGEEDIDKKDEVEELSDAESDDEWQFEKPVNQEGHVSLIVTGNGIGENPFGTSGVLGETTQPVYLSQTVEETITLMKEHPSENTTESFNPFSAETQVFDGTFDGDHTVIKCENADPFQQENVDLLGDFGVTNQGFSNASVSGEVLELPLPSVSNQEQHGGMDGLQETSSADVFQPKDTSILSSIPVNDFVSEVSTKAEELNPFYAPPSDTTMEFREQSNIESVEAAETPEPEFSANQDQLASNNPFDMGMTQAVTQQFDPPYSSEGIILASYEGAGQIQFDSSSRDDDDYKLAHVESNPIPEDLMDEVEQVSQQNNLEDAGFDPCSNMNPFSNEHQGFGSSFTVPPLEQTGEAPQEAAFVGKSTVLDQQLSLSEPVSMQQPVEGQHAVSESVPEDTFATATSPDIFEKSDSPSGLDEVGAFTGSVQESEQELIPFANSFESKSTPTVDAEPFANGAELDNNQMYGDQSNFANHCSEIPAPVNVEANDIDQQNNDELVLVTEKIDEPVMRTVMQSELAEIVANQLPEHGVVGRNEPVVADKNFNDEIASPDIPAGSVNQVLEKAADVPELKEIVPAASGDVQSSIDTEQPASNSHEPAAVALPEPICKEAEATVSANKKAVEKVASKGKVDSKTAKPLKSPVKPDVTAAKTTKPLGTAAAAPKKLPTKPVTADSSQKMGMVNGKSAVGAKPSAAKPALNASKPAPTKGTIPSASSKPTSARVPSTITRTAPPKTLKDGESRSAAAKPAATTTTKPRPPVSASAPKSAATSAPAKAATSPKRVPTTTSSTTARSTAISRPAPGAASKVGDSTAKPGVNATGSLAKPRPKPSTTIGARTSVNTVDKTSPESKRLPAQKPMVSGNSTVPKTTARPAISRSAPTSARTAPPSKPAATTAATSGNRTASARSAPKPAVGATTSASRVAAKPATKAPATTAAKKVDSALKTKKPAPPAVGNKAVKKAAVENVNVELIQINGLSDKEGGESVKELHPVNGMNGNLDETEKQDAVKENGLHHDNSISAPLDDLLA